MGENRAPKQSKDAKTIRTRRKNPLLDRRDIDRAMRTFRTSTQANVVHRALDAVVDIEAFQRELDKGFDTLIGSGGFSDRP